MGELLARLGAILLRGQAAPIDPSRTRGLAQRKGRRPQHDSIRRPSRHSIRHLAAPSADLPRTTLQRYRALEARVLRRLQLSPRESEVALRILQGATYHDIGQKLFIAESTVRFHARHIFEKAQVDNRRSFERSMRRWLARSAADGEGARRDGPRRSEPSPRP